MLEPNYIRHQIWEHELVLASPHENHMASLDFLNDFGMSNIARFAFVRNLSRRVIWVAMEKASKQQDSN